MKKPIFLLFLITFAWTGCTYETLPAPAFNCENGVSFSEDIKPIIETKCAIAGCHDGSASYPPDFNVFENFQERAELVKRYTGDGTMPKTGSLSPSQIDAIACWVDNGALAN